MPHHPVHIEYVGTPHLPSAELAALRRLRGMEGRHPAVKEWFVRIEASDEDLPDALRFRVTAQSRIAGGDVLRGQARGRDALDALRLALNRLEAELDAEHEQARKRAAHWLTVVRRRFGQQLAQDY